MGDRLRTLVAPSVLVAVAAVVALVLGSSTHTTSDVPAAPVAADPAGTASSPGAPTVQAAPSRAGLRAPLPAAGSRAGTRVCDKFGSAPVAGGRYEVQNDAWGDDTGQCTTAFDVGFSVAARHDKDSGPAAYPSIVYGCNYGKCTVGSPFPRPVTDLGDLRSSWTTEVPGGGDYNISYDVWLDPTPRRDGPNTGAELMIWLEHTDRVQPIGSRTGTAQLAGTTWDVWTGANQGTPVISYVRREATRSVLDLPISDFVTDATRRGTVRDSWYLTSIQAGFEPWIGGNGLATTAYSVTRDGV